MAIKGKKKSQKRGSQARRRPAAPPRPAVAPRRTAWYRSQTGIAILGILALAIITVVVLRVQSAREASEELERRQDALDTYTDQVRTVLQSLRPAAAGMATAPPALEEPELAEELEKNAADWTKRIEEAQTQLGGAAPSGRVIELEPSVQNINNLYAQSISMYLTAARTYQLAATLDGTAQADALASATAQRGQASAVWTEATALLDKRRSSAEIDPSGLTAPDAPAAGETAPGTMPGPLPSGFPTEELPPEGEIPPGEGGGGGDGGGQGGGGN
ncbi:MAG: hypothetical protein M3174_05975 [Actinomycetota bacterium]|nr:hypothetical protein [Actinomycetota bacterium]